MLLIDSLRFQLAEASTVFVHLSLIFSVGLYAVFGAVCMQYLESPERVKNQVKRDAIRVFSGPELAGLDPQIHECIENTLGNLFTDTDCHDLDHYNIQAIDLCYQMADVSKLFIPFRKEAKASVEEVKEEAVVEDDPWSFGNSLIFAFTVITTIGYGHVAPVTFKGRLFCIIYGVIGIPMTLLTIADMGMFFSKILRYLVIGFSKLLRLLGHFGKFKSPRNSAKSSPAKSMSQTEEETEEEREKEKEESTEKKSEESIALGIVFGIYLFVGAKLLSIYEPEMDFFKALYFNFVTLTTIGLGDFVPKSFDYLFVTLVYIAIGLALTTMAVEIAAELLRKVHYAGRTIENVANSVVWFGGKKMTMKNLMKHLGDKFDIPEEQMANFNMDEFVENAMKVEKGEIKTLRKPSVVFRDGKAFSYSNLRESEIHYADESRVSKLTELNTDRSGTPSHRDTINLSTIPHLDLDLPAFMDESAPTSFDMEYMKTLRTQRRRM